MRYSILGGIERKTRKLSKKFITLIALAILGLGVATAMLLTSQALATGLDPFPSTNTLNKAKQVPDHIGQAAPYVEQTAATANSVTLKFNNPSVALAFFEVKIDGDTPSGLNPNSNPCTPSGTGLNCPTEGGVYPTGARYIADGDFSYHTFPTDYSKAVSANSSQTVTVPATSKVEVRVTQGGERDWDFDWTEFDVAQPPVAPTNLHFTQGAKTLACGVATGASGIYSTHLLWTVPASETITLWRVTPTYPSGSHGTPYSWTSGSDAWIGANIGQGYGAAPHDQGVYSYSVQYKGTNGLWSDTATCDLTYDTTVPSVVFTSPNNGAFTRNLKVSVNMSGTYSNLKQYGFDVTGPDGIHFSTANYQIDAPNLILTDLDLCAAAHYGTCPSTLPEGEYSVRAKAYDAAGNRNISTHISFTVDTTPPVVTVSPAAGSLLRGTVTFTITVDDDHLNPATLNHIWSYLYNTAPPQKSKGASVDLSTGTGTLTIDTTLLDDGDASLDVGRLFDAAGNASGTTDTYFRHYSIDNTAPVVTASPVAGSLLHGTETFDITVTDDHVKPTDTVWVYLYNTLPPQKSRGASVTLTNGHGTFTVNTKLLDDGKANLDVGRLYDLAGNASGATDNYFRNYIVDNTRPTINFINPTRFNTTSYDEYFQTGPNIQIQASDANGIETTVLHVYNADNTAAKFCPAANSDTTSCDTSSLPDGEYYVKAGSNDNAGNNQTLTRSFAIDSTAPAAPTNLTPVDNAYTNVNDFYFDWTDVSDAVEYEFQSSQNPAVGTDGGLTTGVWNNIANGAPDRDHLTSSTIHSYGANGIWYWQVRAIDAAGNKSDWTAPWKLTIDMAAPDEPTATPPAGNYTGTQLVTLSANDNSGGSGVDAVYYTTDGSTPDSSSAEYTGPITVSADMTIKAIAYDNAGNPSSVLTAVYGIAPVIDGEQAVTPTTSSVTITWTTSQPATSRVIYDTVSHSAIGSAPNYGYAFSTVEDSTKVLNHSVIVSGLTPGTQYYFRGVSHGSPESVSGQIAASTLTPPAATSAAGQDNGQNTGTAQVQGAQNANVQNQANDSQEPDVLGQQTTNSSIAGPATNFADAVTPAKGSSSFLALGWWWLAVLAAVLAGIYWLVARRSDDEQKA